MSEEMKKNKKGLDQQSCLISKEVLLFLEWIMLYDSKLLDNFIKKIWIRGFEKICLDEMSDEIALTTLDAQQVIFDFFAHLEFSVNKLSKKNIVNKQKKSQGALSENLFLDVAIEDELESLSGNVGQVIDKNKIVLLDDDRQKIKKDFYKKFLHKWNTNNIIAE